jgi:hypothetical protein
MLKSTLKNSVNLFVVVLFLISQNSYAASRNLYPTFNVSMNKILNKYKTSHDYARAILKNKPEIPFVIEEAKKALKQKNIIMPEYKITDDVLNFVYLNKKYSLKHIAASRYLVNGKKVDLLKRGWENEVAYSRSINIFWNEAEALAPLYFAITIVIGLLAVGCMAEGLGTARQLPSGITAKFVSAPSLNKVYNEVSKNICRACGGACASATGNHLNYYDYLKSYCSAIGERGLELYKHPRARSSRKPEAIRLKDGKINPNVYEFIKNSTSQITAQNFPKRFSEKYQFQSCLNDSCLQLGPNKSYNELDGPIQDFLDEITSSDEFNSQCAVEGAKDILEPKEGPIHEEVQSRETINQ